jgi:hypothetical protein
MPTEVRCETMSADEHATDAHGDVHGDVHGPDDHAHPEETLGPIDLRAWGAALLGVLLGAVVGVAFALTTNALV